jgi:hypothetical protein
MLNLFVVLRVYLSICPRCNQRYFGFNWLFTGGLFILSSLKLFKANCRHCDLSMSELPEAEKYRKTTHRKEWLD